MAWIPGTTQPNDAQPQFQLASVSRICHSVFQNVDRPYAFDSCQSLRCPLKNTSVFIIFEDRYAVYVMIATASI